MVLVVLSLVVMGLIEVVHRVSVREAVGAAVVKVAGRPHSGNTCSPSY